VLADKISRLDSFYDAMDARVILANFSNQLILCKGHMTLPTFIHLQSIWTRDLLGSLERPNHSSVTHSRNQPKQLIGAS
jgi:hypothetical protein